MLEEKIEKINLNDITENYEVKNTEAFTQYLKQVWKDLKSRSGEETTKGIDKNGQESMESTYTSAVPSDVVGPGAFDGDMNTGF